MNISANGLSFIEGFEGGQSPDGLFHAYFDRYGGVWTIGYGETANVHVGMTWTHAQAEAELRASIERSYEPAINGLGVALNQNQFDALCSFVWNLGPGSMAWDVGRDLRAGNYGAAADAMLQYDHAGGVRLAGLTRRRQAERALFLTPYAAPVPPDPHHYLRFPPGPFAWRGQLLHERSSVTEYDRLRAHPFIHRPALHVLRGRLKDLADRIAFEVIHEAARSGKPRDWGYAHRGWRYQQLILRWRGERLA